MKRLARPFAVSLILHLAVLSQVNWDSLHPRAHVQHRFTVSLSRDQPTEDRNRSEVHPEQNEHEKDISQSARRDEVIRALDTNGSDYSLDMNQIRSQAREYARQEFATSDQGLPPRGDYYGTYTGDDSGTFSFHLDAAGHVSGTGESKALGIVFAITGNIRPNGVIHMIAAVKDARASLSGQLNAKTGKVSGSWFVQGLAEGLFSGQHE